MSQYASLEPGMGGYAGRSSSAVSQLLEWLSTCLAALDLRQCLPMQMLTAGEEVEMNGKKFQILKQVRAGDLLRPPLCASGDQSDSDHS